MGLLLIAALAFADPPTSAASTYRDAAITLHQEVSSRGTSTRFTLRSVPVFDPGEVDVDLYLYRGPDRLDVPAFLALVGEHDRAEALDVRISRDRRAATWLFALGGVGTLTAIVGIAGLERFGASGSDVGRTNMLLFAGGSAAMTIGFLGGSIPATRARRMNRRPLTTLELAELLAWQQAYNERLRVDLGLTPEATAP